jgi:hypothetical protein
MLTVHDGTEVIVKRKTKFWQMYQELKLLYPYPLLFAGSASDPDNYFPDPTYQIYVIFDHYGPDWKFPSLKI